MQAQPLFAFGQDCLQQIDRAEDGLFAVFTHQSRRRAVDVPRGTRYLRQTPRLARTQDGTVQRSQFFHATQHARQADAVILRDPAHPAAFEFQRNIVQPVRNRIRHLLQVRIRLARVKGPGKCCLFQDVARVMGGKGLQHAAELPRAFDHAGKVRARDFLAGAKSQNSAFDAHPHKVVFQRRLILQVNLGLAARHFVKRRLRDIQVTAVDHLRHLAEEEGQQQRADMRAIDIGVGHDDDLVVAQLPDVEFIPPDAGAKGGDQRANFLAAQHPVKARAFHVQDFALERQDRLVGPAAALLGRTAGAVAFHQKDFGLRRIAFLAVGQLAGQRGHVQRGLAARQLAGLTGGFAGQSGFDDLGDNLAGGAGIFLEPLGQLFVDQVFDRRAHFGRHQLVLGLAGEFRIGHLDGQHAGQPFTRVIAGELDLFLFGDARGLGIVVDRACQRAAKARKMRAAVALRDVVGKGQHRFMVAVIPPHRDFHRDPGALAHNIDRLWHDGGFRAVQIADIFPHAAFIEQFRPQRFRRTLILQQNAHAGIQEGQFAQAVFQRLEDIVEVREGLGRGQKAHLGAFFARRIADDAQMLYRVAMLKAGEIFLAVAPDAQFQPVGQGVDNGNANAMQATRHLVTVLVEFPACVQLGHDDFGGRNAFFRVNVHGDAPAIVAHRNRVVGVNPHRDGGGVTGQCLVNAIVHHLIDHVVQTRPIVGIADIHAWPLSDSLQPLENPDRV